MSGRAGSLSCLMKEVDGADAREQRKKAMYREERGLKERSFG